MNLREVVWRVDQKMLQRREQRRFGSVEKSVGSEVFNDSLNYLEFNPNGIGINFENKRYDTKTVIHLLKGPDFEKWPNTFSYKLDYKQRDDLGDARTNWEKDRHFQFALLAKAYYVTGNEVYAKELERLFGEWNAKNVFLHGIAWTSVMEVAIRCIQWCVTLSFLQRKGYTANNEMMVQLETGIKNMAEYIVKHYSRFSSANNHLLVEATAIAYAGFAFKSKEWMDLAIRLLDEELLKQNYTDGVNKEMALHYQTFGMEAYALVMLLMKRYGMGVPSAWKEMLAKQCEFVAYSMVNDTEACEFGDNDEGKIIDLEGGDISHYRYLLQLCSLVLGIRFSSFSVVSETISWLFTEKEIEECEALPIYLVAESRTFEQGGYSFLRSKDGQIVIGIDHAPLGFGSIAAHGHADALSFQLYVKGKCIFGDPGTFIYHCNLPKRNEYRRSRNHNTVWVEDEEQSQMMGAFLWGKKAETSLMNKNFTTEEDFLQAECNWHNGNKHIRTFKFDKKECLEITDRLKSSQNGYATLMLYPVCEVFEENGNIIISRDDIKLKISADAVPMITDAWYSTEYGKEEQTKKIVYQLKNNNLKIKIWIEKY